VDKETADELRRVQRHGLITIVLIGAVVLPLEGDDLVVAGDEARVGDGHTVGIPGQIFEHGAGTGKRRPGIDHPLGAT